MKIHRHPTIFLATLLAGIILQTPAPAAQTDIAGPAGSGEFGRVVAVLPNGNIVVTDPSFDLPVANVGRVTLMSPTGTVISTLTGSTSGDQVGSSGVVILSNGNFVVSSPDWDNGAVVGAGAVTYGSATTGFIGGASVTVSTANSLVGSTVGDFVGFNGVAALTNGNYVVRSSFWDNGAATNAGAVTWGNGTTGTSGTVSAANSLVGSTASDFVGSTGLTVLTNGNYVVRSKDWDNGAATNVGAVTWGNGTTGTSGAVSAANSLVGSTASDNVGSTGVTPLTNGNYVVRSTNWDNGAATNAGAATWGNGTTGISGTVSAANSLVGSTTSDNVGSTGVTPLTNGNYVVASLGWNNGATANVGAVTWGNGTTGISGTVSAANSLVGSTATDNVGIYGVAALTNGNYVVRSPTWDNGAAADAGAATWGNGTTGITGTVSSANSLVGTTTNDKVGSNVTALTNGNYVVASIEWNNGAIVDAGAATWGNGTTGAVGPVSVSNSLVGTSTNDFVGFSRALTNGNYVVTSSSWSNGATTDVGAATWANGTTGITGTVSPSNSLTGTTAGDGVGSWVMALPNGNYVVASEEWHNGAAANAGAVTWGNGTTGITGTVSSSNSLVGSSTDDYVGWDGYDLANGNYVIMSPFWTGKGAVTWGNGAGGTTGVVSAGNSLVGSTVGDFGDTVNGEYYDVQPNPDSSYTVGAALWDNGATTDAGAITLGNGNGGTVGVFTASNSVLGTVASGGANLRFGYDSVREQLVVGRRDSNVVSLFTPGTGTGSVAFSSTLFTVTEASGIANITINRTGGALGAASVTFLTTPGTATIGALGDYLANAGTVVNFAAGQTSATISVNILNGNATNEPNETFGVSLTGPVGATLGSITAATVRIVDAGDTTAPSAPTITAPAAAALVGVNAGGTTTITGTATDGKGIKLVEVQLNGGAFVPATLSNVTGTGANWSAAITPRTGSNTINVRCTDTADLVSGLTSRTFKVTRPLIVKTNGTGTISPAGFTPTSFREVGTSFTLSATATATPAPGTLFAGWTLTGPNVNQMGLTPSALQKSTLTFIFREGTQLAANFVPNPFISTVTGNYRGFITTTGVPSNSTEGIFAATVQATGSFSGTLTMDGFVLNFAGALDHNGVARFGTSRASTLRVARPGKPSLILEFNLDLGLQLISGFVNAVDYRNMPAGQSQFFAVRSFYDGITNVVPSQYLGPANANGVFNVVFPARPVGDQPVGFQASWYPQGDGIGTITITKSGMVTLTNCTLADGTTGITASAPLFLTPQPACDLFIPLYNNKGYLRARIFLDDTQATSDLSAGGFDATWLRPAQNTHHYPDGWPEIIKVGLVGAKYTATTGLSVLRAPDGPDVGNDIGEPLKAADEDGNAVLQFSDGQLEGLLTKNASISTTDVVTKVPANDPTFTLTINRATGIFTGTFTHTDDSVPAFSGIIFQKGPNAGGFGHFLTKPPTPIDYTGESGGVTLTGLP